MAELLRWARLSGSRCGRCSRGRRGAWWERRRWRGAAGSNELFRSTWEELRPTWRWWTEKFDPAGNRKSADFRWACRCSTFTQWEQAEDRLRVSMRRERCEWGRSRRGLIQDQFATVVARNRP